LRDCKQSLSLVAQKRDLFSACESLRLPQASLRDCEQSLSLVALRATFFRPVKAALPGGLSPDARRAAGIGDRAQRPPKKHHKNIPLA
ncbi:MAG: hypothetical protein ACI4ME_10865, partial [Aristaeellaceae bacterium]